MLVCIAKLVSDTDHIVDGSGRSGMPDGLPVHRKALIQISRAELKALYRALCIAITNCAIYS